MPDANDNFKAAFYNLSPERYAKIFGDPWDPDPVEIDPPEMVWEPPPELDGAHFTPEN